MSVCSIEFFAGLTLVSVVFFLLPGIRTRQVFLAGLNAGFLLTHIPDLASFLTLAGFLLSGYLVARLLRARPRFALLVTYLLAMLAAFVYLKGYEFLDLYLPERWLRHGIQVVGLSYMLFRQVHFVVDMTQGQIDRPSLWTYLNYQLCVFTLISGPIQRYPAFSDYWNSPRPLLRDRHEILMAHARILVGVVRIAVVGSVCLTAYQLLDSDVYDTRWQELAAGWAKFYLFPMYVYFNFAGYCDMVIGGAALLGLPLPENFDRPYLSRNIGDLWMRWHRTLGLFIRDYIFTPGYRMVQRRWPRRAAGLAHLCYLAAFLLVGMWHGTSSNFLVFGLLQAVGISAARLWEAYLVRTRGRKGLKAYLASPRIRVAAIVLTLHYFCFTTLFFAQSW